jgi:hypothetical protein
MTIGIGHVLGAWNALSPDTMIPSMPTDIKMSMAQNGMVSLQHSTE